MSDVQVADLIIVLIAGSENPIRNILIHLAQTLQLSTDCVQCHGRYRVFHIGQNIRNFFQSPLATLRQIGAKFVEQATYLGNLHGANLDQLLPHAVQRQDGLLLLALNRHEAHIGPLYSFPDSRGIGSIVLIGFHEGTHELGSDQSDLIAELAQFPCPIVGAAAGLHGDNPGLPIGKKLQ